MDIEVVEIQCPSCGEWIELEVDPTSTSQSTVQDCSVCCRPMQLLIVFGEDGAQVNASRCD